MLKDVYGFLPVTGSYSPILGATACNPPIGVPQFIAGYTLGGPTVNANSTLLVTVGFNQTLFYGVTEQAVLQLSSLDSQLVVFTWCVWSDHVSVC